MLGWDVKIYKNKGNNIIYWSNLTFNGLDFVLDAVERGDASGGGSGYPCLFTVKGKLIKDNYKSNYEKHSKMLVSSSVRINEEELSKLKDEDVVIVEAWDLS